MISGLYTAASGMAAYQAKLEVLANNLANIDTPGFKADFLTIDASAPSPDSLSEFALPAAAVEPGRLVLNPAPGPLRLTGNALDLAIVGDGLFVVETPQGERYTRAGSFTRDAEGFLATPDGYRVQGSRGPIRIPESGMRVDETGTLSGGERLRLVSGPGGDRLVKMGANLYAVADGQTAPEELAQGRLLQGHVESSNVSPILTMVEMLATLRSYEAYQKTVQSLDQTAGQAANELGRA